MSACCIIIGDCTCVAKEKMLYYVFAGTVSCEYDGLGRLTKVVPSQQKWTQKRFKKRNESYSFFCFRKTAAFIPRFA